MIKRIKERIFNYLLLEKANTFGHKDTLDEVDTTLFNDEFSEYVEQGEQASDVYASFIKLANKGLYREFSSSKLFRALRVSRSWRYKRLETIQKNRSY